MEGQKNDNQDDKIDSKNTHIRMEQFFAEIDEELKKVSDEDLKYGVEQTKKFLEGKIGWAELFSFTPQMLYQLAESAYAQFKSGRYEEAEKIFKALTVLDSENAYYHAMMGAILQRQRRYGEAAAEYTVAIELDPNDVASLTNRGEILLRFGVVDEAKADLEKAARLDPDKTDRWAARARMLLENLNKGKRGKTKGR